MLEFQYAKITESSLKSSEMRLFWSKLLFNVIWALIIVDRQKIGSYPSNGQKPKVIFHKNLF